MLEIVTHCYSAPPVPTYHTMLALQINSLLTDKNKFLSAKMRKAPPVTLTVCYTDSDPYTTMVLDSLRALENNKLALNPLPLKKSQLFRRAIGRNIAAKQTEADVVWFTDCDHLFMVSAIEAAYRLGKRLETKEKKMIHPQQVMINRSHERGDSFALKAFSFEWGDLSVPMGDFMPRQEKRAIGGLQIVSGNWAREHGYLDGTEWVKEVDADHFLSCKCDVAYRKFCGGSTPQDIPGLFRVRHSFAGRDKGEVDHSLKAR